MFWTYILPLIASIAAVSIIHPQLVKIALRKHIVDEPNARKFQEHPVPTMGGIAVFFGIAVGMASLCFSGICSSFFVVVIAMLVMLYLGTIDDILDISPLLRMLIQVLTVLLLIYAGGYCLDDLHGLWGYDSISWYVAVPLTLISVVGIINAMNMIDGVDGLSSGLCMLYCLIFGVAFHLVGYVGMAAFAITAFGALLPFFMHNAFGRTSKMYIGNGGTMLMGILLSVFVMSMVRTDDFDEFSMPAAIRSCPLQWRYSPFRCSIRCASCSHAYCMADHRSSPTVHICITCSYGSGSRMWGQPSG